MTVEEETISYQYVQRFDPDEILFAYGKMLQQCKFNENDSCFVSDDRSELRLLNDALKKSGKKTTTTFEDEAVFQKIKKTVYRDPNIKAEDKQKTLKMRIQSVERSIKFHFWMNAGCIKLSTIQSFKGWEINAVVLILHERIQRESKEAINELIYTALTRCKNHLLIINIGNNDYDRFFRRELGKESYKEVLIKLPIKYS